MPLTQPGQTPRRFFAGVGDRPPRASPSRTSMPHNS